MSMKNSYMQGDDRIVQSPVLVRDAVLVTEGQARRRPSRAARIRLHRIRVRAIYAMPPEPSPERTRLWRLVLGAENALVKMIARREFPDEPNLVAAAALLDQYRGVRRLERCLERMRATGSRALVVGESPNGREHAFDGPSGRRLAYLLGLPDVKHLDDLVECRNLLTDAEVEAGAETSATMDLVHARATALPTRRRVVIVCGRTAAAGFGLEDAPFFEWREVGRAAVIVIPHPSSRSRWWNDEDNQAAAARSLGWLGRRLRIALGLVSSSSSFSSSSSPVVTATDQDNVDDATTPCSKGEVSRNLRTSVSEDVGDAIDALCEEDGISPSAWLRALAIREIRLLTSIPGGQIYGCVCGHRRGEHRRDRDRDGEFYGTCACCDVCSGYRQAPPPSKTPRTDS